VTNDSVIGKLASTDGDWSNFAKATDSLQSLRDTLATSAQLSAAIEAAALATADSVSAVQDSIDALDWSARAILSGTVNTVNSKADFTLTGDFSATDSMYARCWLVFTTGPNRGTGRLIGTYTGETKRVQFTGGGSRGEFVATVSAGDEFYIVPTTDLVAGIIGVKNV
jgi:hypothetical protein